MELTHVKGKKKRGILLYALSTCGWCKKTKQMLNDKGVEYSYVDVDLLDDEENERVIEEVKRWNPICSFPTIVVDNKQCIQGFKPEELLKVINE
jgi:glutaredoxin